MKNTRLWPNASIDGAADFGRRRVFFTNLTRCAIISQSRLFGRTRIVELDISYPPSTTQHTSSILKITNGVWWYQIAIWTLMHVNWNVRTQKRSETAVWTVLMGCAPTLPPQEITIFKIPRTYWYAPRRAAPPRSQVCPGPGGYRTFKFSFQVRIRHRYVKKIIWIAHPARSLTLQGTGLLNIK